MTTLAALAGCTTQSALDPTPGATPPPAPRVDLSCPAVYEPVCGDRNGQRRTLSNACNAALEGYQLIDKGECQ